MISITTAIQQTNMKAPQKREKRDKYMKIDETIRMKLVKLVFQKSQTVKEASEFLGIKFSTSKSIVKLYREEGKVFKNQQSIQEKKQKKIDKQKKKSLKVDLGQEQSFKFTTEPFQNEQRICNLDQDFVIKKQHQIENEIENTQNFNPMCNPLVMEPLSFFFDNKPQHPNIPCYLQFLPYLMGSTQHFQNQQHFQFSHQYLQPLYQSQQYIQNIFPKMAFQSYQQMNKFSNS